MERERAGGFYSLVAASLVQEVEILDQQTEEGHNDPLSFVRSAGATPHRRFQCTAVAAEIAARIHLVLKNREFRQLHL